MTNTLDDALVLSIQDALLSHAMSMGRLDKVQGHEPKNAPSSGLTAALWIQLIEPLPAASGLNTTSGVLTWMFRIYQNFLSDPQDAIDPGMLAAGSDYIGRLSGDFDLGGTVRNIDLLKQASDGLRGQAGYLTQDGKLFRVLDITIPAIVNDLWTQAA